MRRRHLAAVTTAGLLAGMLGVATPAVAAGPDCGDYRYVETGRVFPGLTTAPYTYFFSVEDPATYDVCLDGPDGAEIDLVVLRLDSVNEVVATAPAGGADKTVTFTGPHAAYRVEFTTRSGSGPFTFGLTMP